MRGVGSLQQLLGIVPGTQNSVKRPQPDSCAISSPSTHTDTGDFKRSRSVQSSIASFFGRQAVIQPVAPSAASTRGLDNKAAVGGTGFLDTAAAASTVPPAPAQQQPQQHQQPWLQDSLPEDEQWWDTSQQDLVQPLHHEELLLQQQDQQRQCAGTAAASREQQVEGPPTDGERQPLAWTVSTRIVGRRFQEVRLDPQVLHPSTQLVLAREPENPIDKNAILVQCPRSSGGLLTLGHLPAVVAKHVAPLLDAGQVDVGVRWAPDAALQRTDSSAPVSLHFAAGGVAAADASGVHGSIEAAVAACNAALAPAAAGVVLCDNFALLLQTIREYDAHLLDAPEHAMLRTVEALEQSARCLLLRLLLRKRQWFHLQSISYTDVPDAEAAARVLAAAQLAVLSCDAAAGAVPPLLASLPAPALRAMAAEALPAQQRAALPTTVDKDTLIHTLQAAAPTARLKELFEEVAGRALMLEPAMQQLFGRVQRIYFLHEGQDMSRFVATERGAMRYPPYTLHRSQPAFADRGALLAYEDALAHAAQLEAALAEDNQPAVNASLQPALQAILEYHAHKHLQWEGAMPNPLPPAPPPSTPSSAGASTPPLSLAATSPAHWTQDGVPPLLTSDAATCPSSNPAAAPATTPASPLHPPVPLFLARFTSAWVHTSMVTVAVSLLEKQRQYAKAAEVLGVLLGGNACPARRGEWWARLSMDLEHQGRLGDALEVAEAALADPWVRHGDRLALQRRVLRLGRPPRRWKRPPWGPAAQAEPPEVGILGRPITNSIGLKSRFYGYDGQQCTVEELALQHYSSDDGGCWQGIHTEGGIWSTLFGLLMWDVLFVDVPDVFRSPFQTAPLDLDTDAFYPARRAAIDGRLQEVALGCAGALLDACWASHESVFCRGVNWSRFPRGLLHEVVECVGGVGLSVVLRLMAEDHAASSGGMPDLLLWAPERREAKLVEVKGPRDRLSDQQRAWLLCMLSAGMQVEVCKVREPGRCKA